MGIDIVLLFMVVSVCNTGQLKVMADTNDLGLDRFKPMVAILCGHGKYHNQYLNENKKWTTDLDPQALCTKDKLEILEYCRKVYPKKDIRNIVESNRYIMIENWCKAGQKCKSKHWVKPYRCLEGPFQSDALLVPEHCLFDHVHNQSVCQNPSYWNKTASLSCSSKSDMRLHNYAMLLPCGVGIFGGVEFVCCPKQVISTTTLPPENKNLDENDNDDSDEMDEYKHEELYGGYDDYDDENFEDDEDEALTFSTTSTTTTTTTTTTARPLDYYLSHFDLNHEHEFYQAAQKSLKENHREKVTKIMKEWSELEERYTQLKTKDPKKANEFKKKMTTRFQKTVEALEKEGSAERKQLISMHQQRVKTVISMRKKAAMDYYTQSLEQVPLKTKRIEKALEKLLRSLEKDRTHTLHRYRHMLNSDMKQALKDKNLILDHLENLAKLGNQSILMLDRIPSIAVKIKDKMIKFWRNLKDLSNDVTVDRDFEEKVLEKYEEEISQKKQEKQKQKMLQEERKQELKELEEEKKLVESNQKNGKLDREFDPESMEDERINSDSSSSSVASENDEMVPNHFYDQKVSSTPLEIPATSANTVLVSHETDNSGIHRIMPTPKVSHIHNQAFHHNEITYSVRKEPFHQRVKWNGSVYITLAFAGIALLMATVIGVIVLKNHRQRSPLNQGFVKVDQAASPEERHVANMQINGYENPTYKYFETHSA